jgi:hypothetical protein
MAHLLLFYPPTVIIVLSLSDIFHRLIEYLEPFVLPLLVEVAMFVGLYVLTV